MMLQGSQRIPGDARAPRAGGRSELPGREPSAQEKLMQQFVKQKQKWIRLRSRHCALKSYHNLSECALKYIYCTIFSMRYKLALHHETTMTAPAGENPCCMEPNQCFERTWCNTMGKGFRNSVHDGLLYVLCISHHVHLQTLFGRRTPGRNIFTHKNGGAWRKFYAQFLQPICQMVGRIISFPYICFFLQGFRGL